MRAILALLIGIGLGGLVIAIVAPGQGSQAPGMFAPWLELPGAEEIVGQMSELSGLDLKRLGTTADADEIKDTAITQPLVVSLALLAWRALEEPTGDIVVAGHSVGELAAAAMAGIMDYSTAVRLAAVRGRAMADACAVTPTSMAAVLGGDPDEVLAAIEASDLSPANQNGGGQVVAAGSVGGIEKLQANPPAKARIMPLSVAGAFHTKYMEPAIETVRSERDAITARDPQLQILSNADGATVDNGTEYLDRLVTQVTRPVRWDRCMETLLGLGVTAIVELPPAGALAGLARRGMKGVKSVAVKSPDDLTTVRELLDA